MRPVVLLLASLASASFAHDVPVLPSACTCDPVAFGAADGTAVADVAPATDADGLRMVYDVAEKVVQLQAPSVPPRAFTIAGVAGRLGFPAATPAALTTDGDLAFAAPGLGGGAWVDVALGGARVAVQMPFTTGLVASAGGVLAGEPLGRDGRFAVVARIPSGRLPAPLHDVESVMRLECRLAPAPDLDRFRPAARLERIRGTLGSRGGRMRAVLLAPEPSALAGAGSVLARVRVGVATLATLIGDELLDPRSRRATTAGAGGRLELRRLGAAARRRWGVVLEIGGPIEQVAPGPLAVTMSFGDTIVRGDSTATARGTALVVR